MKTLFFWFDFSCPYAYLASARVEAMASRVGARVEWEPMFLGGIFRAAGTPLNLASTLSPAKALHTRKDLERWTRLWELPLQWPPQHPMRTVDALRVVLAGSCDPRLIHGFYRAYWVEGVDISDESVLRRVTEEAGHSADELLERSRTPEVRADLRERTERAVSLGIFGAPACVVGTKVYWGQDRLGQAERALGGAPAPLAEPIATDTAHPVDFWFDYASPFAYLGACRVRRYLAGGVRYRPILLGGLFKSIGTANVPLFEMPEAKRAYQLLDLQRQARDAGVPFAFPAHFPMNTVKALRLTHAVGPDTTDGRALVSRIFRAFWAEGADISNEAVLTALCKEVGLDSARLLAACGQAETKAALRHETEAAEEAGVFGVPTMTFGNRDGTSELYWGADRLELAVRSIRSRG